MQQNHVIITRHWKIIKKLFLRNYKSDRTQAIFGYYICVSCLNYKVGIFMWIGNPRWSSPHDLYFNIGPDGKHQ